MSAPDRFYKDVKGWKPRKAHLVRGQGGLSGEINDLRGDVEEALERVANESASVQNLQSAQEATLQAAIADAQDTALAAVAAESGILNDRIGQRVVNLYTDDATPVVAVSFTPSPYSLYRMSIKVLAQRVDMLEKAAYSIAALASAIPSSGIMTLAGQVTDGDQVVIGTTTYTFKTTLSTGPSVPYEVLIGGDAQGTIDNLVKAVNKTGTDDVEYGAGTAANPVASAVKASAATMEAVARTPGVAGDTIATTDPVDTGVVISWGGATMSGGSDMTLHVNTPSAEHEDQAAWDAALSVNVDELDLTITGDAFARVKWYIETKVEEIIGA